MEGEEEGGEVGAEGEGGDGFLVEVSQKQAPSLILPVAHSCVLSQMQRENQCPTVTPLSPLALPQTHPGPPTCDGVARTRLNETRTSACV